MGSRYLLSPSFFQARRLAKVTLPCEHRLNLGNFQCRAASTKPPTQEYDKKQSDGGSKSKLVLLAGVGLVTTFGLIYGYNVMKEDQSVWNALKETLGISFDDDKTPGNNLMAIAVAENLQKERHVGENATKFSGQDAGSVKGDTESGSHKLDREEDIVEKQVGDLEKALKEFQPKVLHAVEAAGKAYNEAADYIKVYIDKAYCAIDDDTQSNAEVWHAIGEAATQRFAKVKVAVEKGNVATELLCKLREIIQYGRNCTHTSSNEFLVTGEETLRRAEAELKSAKAKLDSVEGESKFVEQYKSLIENFWRDLKAEMDSLMTQDTSSGNNLTKNEATMILTHAYRKVMSIQKELAMLQSKVSSRVSDLPELQQMLNDMKVNYEAELLQALSRQAKVHYESVEISKDLIRGEYQRRLKQISDVAESEKLIELRSRYKQAVLALDAMKTSLEERKNQDSRADKLGKLWTYCSSLQKQINFGFGGKDGCISIHKQKLLTEYSENEFVVTLLRTIPDHISSVESLRTRFYTKIDRTCRNVGVFRNGENVSLGRYIWGYIQGSLTTRCDGDFDTPTTIFQILDKTSFHLRRGELLEAVLSLNKTEGTAREICQDWLSDARRVLEVRQTIYAILTHINAHKKDTAL